MIDLDFLLNEKPPLKHHIIYTVKTHALRPAVSAKLRAYVDARGLATRTLDLERPLLSAAESSLLSDFFIWVDLDELVAQKSKTALDTFVNLAAYLLDHPTLANRLFLYTSDEKLLAHPLYAELSKAYTHLEEISVSESTLPKLLDFVALSNPSLDLAALTNRQAFLDKLKTLLDDEMTLPDLLHAIEYYATLCINPVTHTFDIATFATMATTQQKTDYYRWHRLIFNLLTTRARPAATALMRELDSAQHIAGFEPRGLVTMLYKATYDLHIVSAALNPNEVKPAEWSEYKWKQLLVAFAGTPPAQLLTWNVHLSRKEPRLNRGDVTAFHDLVSALIAK